MKNYWFKVIPIVVYYTFKYGCLIYKEVSNALKKENIEKLDREIEKQLGIKEEENV